MIIVSITGPGLSNALRQIESSEQYADLLELRLDLIGVSEISRLMNAAKKPVIATCRPAWEGGTYTGSERERINLLVTASLLGAAFIDLERNAERTIREEFLRRRGESQVIISHHLLGSERFSVVSLYKKLSATGADVIKLAFTATDADDNLLAFKFLSLAKADRQPAIAIAMGEAGEPSRVLYRKFGGWATYASSEEGRAAAPGQIPARQLKEIYHAHTLTPQTKVYGVVGSPLRQSKGVFVHNEMFRRARVNAVYCKFAVTNLPAFMKSIAPLLHGFSVTIPHKEAILPYLDRVEPRAVRIGSVNTVIRRAKKLIGSNTDAGAALDAIEGVVRVKGKTLLVVGAGGAARAIAFEAKQRGARVLVTGRTVEKAARMALEFRVDWVPIEEIRNVTFDIVANATPVGMVPNSDASLVPKDILPGKIVFDAVYNPRTTKLLEEAAHVGAKTITGVEMYIKQAAAQSALFAGRRPDLKAMKDILLAHL